MSSAMMIDEDEAKELESGDDFIHVMVTDPHKIGDGMSSFIGKLFFIKVHSTGGRRRVLDIHLGYKNFVLIFYTIVISHILV